MGGSWHANIVLIAIVVFTSYVVWGVVADGREAQRLADLGPCGLAQTYASWRVGAGDVACDEPQAQDAACAAFAEGRRAFEQAARLVVVDSVPPAQAAVVEQLRALAGQRADRSDLAQASDAAFMDAFANACPLEFGASTAKPID